MNLLIQSKTIGWEKSLTRGCPTRVQTQCQRWRMASSTRKRRSLRAQMSQHCSCTTHRGFGRWPPPKTHLCPPALFLDLGCRGYHISDTLPQRVFSGPAHPPTPILIRASDSLLATSLSLAFCLCLSDPRSCSWDDGLRCLPCFPWLKLRSVYRIIRQLDIGRIGSD